MLSTHEQFLKRFTEHICGVADFDGDESNGLTVIQHSLSECGLKEICDELDRIKVSGGSTVVAPVESKKVKKVSSKKSTAATASSETEEKATKSTKKRVTAYNVFVGEHVKKPGVTMKDAAAVWKEMSAQDKEPFTEEAIKRNSA